MGKRIPVVVIKELSETDKILTALKNYGIKCAEITFRTACAEEAIAYACEKYPEMNIGAGAAVSGGSLMLWGVGTIAIQSIGGIIGVSSGLAQTTALGTAAFNLGGFIMAALQGIKTPEPVEFPAQPQASTYYTPITGY